jgi:nitrogen fixation/metabolism regulation signal transduction histidine kinase
MTVLYLVLWLALLLELLLALLLGLASAQHLVPPLAQLSEASAPS